MELMVQIYSMARKVLIWLGSATDESDAAFDHLTRLSNRLNLERVPSDAPDVIESLLAIRGK